MPAPKPPGEESVEEPEKDLESISKNTSNAFDHTKI